MEDLFSHNLHKKTFAHTALDLVIMVFRLFKRLLRRIFRLRLLAGELSLSLQRRAFRLISRIIIAVAAFVLVSHGISLYSGEYEESSLTITERHPVASMHLPDENYDQSLLTRPGDADQRAMMFIAVSMFLFFGITISACDYLRCRRVQRRSYRRLAGIRR